MDEKLKANAFAADSDNQAHLSPVISVQEGHVDADVQKHGNLHRTLTPRMIHVCPLRGGYA